MIQRIAMTAFACAAIASSALAGAPSIDRPTDQHLRGDLARVLDDAAPTDLVPVTFVMADVVSRDDLQPFARLVDKRERRAAVVARLRDSSRAATGDLMALLEGEQAKGNVGARLEALWIANVVATSATPDVIRRVAQRADVSHVNFDRPVGEEVLARGIGGGPTIECGVDLMRAPDVWADFGFTGAGVVIGIIDTGCCVTHPDLANQIWTNPGEIAGNGLDDDGNGYVDDVMGWNFRDDNDDPFDDGGHGTHTAGSIAGDGTNGERTGMAPDVELMVLKFWNDFAGESIVWEAMQYAVDNGADAVSASIGWPHSFTDDRATWRMVCENAMASGLICIYAAGNEGSSSSPPDEVRTPGDVPDMITIGAVNCGDGLASFSSNGPVTWQDVPEYGDWPYPPGLMKPTVCGPGVDTLSTWNNCSGYFTLSGTSMATPHVAGAVALALEANRSLDHFQMKALLEQNAIDLGAPGPDNAYGWGRVDAYALVEAAMATACPSDVDGSGDVGFGDLVDVLSNWGPCAGCPQDLDGSGDVGLPDLLAVLSNWGPC